MATEAKKRRTNADRAAETVESLRGEIAYWVGRYAGQAAWSFERILNWRKDNIFNHPRYGKLPCWARAKLETVFYIHLRHLEHSLVWTHVFNGKRVLSGDYSIKDLAKEIHDQRLALAAEGKANSAFCYAYCLPDRRLLLIPYRESDRVLEMESGRLTGADAALIYNQETVRLNRGNLLNGTQALTITVAVSVDDGVVNLPEPVNHRLF